MSFLASPPSADALRQVLLTNRARTLTQLYQRAFPAVRRHVERCGGSVQDAQDIFHDALVILYEQAVRGELVLTATPGTYVVAISRNLWHHEQCRRARHPHTDLGDELGQLAEEASPAVAEPTLAVLDYVEQLGEKCKSILLAFYYFQQPLAQIAATYQYRTVRSATVQKFKCLERLRHAVRAAVGFEAFVH